MGETMLPPKPSKDFHEAYKALHGEDKELAKLDLPPPKEPPKLGKQQPKQEKKEKKGFFAKLFGKKEEPKDALDMLSEPPKKSLDLHQDQLLEGMDLPPPKKEGLPNFDKELDALDIPPITLPKENKKPALELPKEKPKKGEKKRVHDFLAEIKFGKGKPKQKPAKEELAMPNKQQSPMQSLPAHDDFGFPDLEIKREAKPKKAPAKKQKEVHFEFPELTAPKKSKKKAPMPKPSFPKELPTFQSFAQQEEVFEKQKMKSGAADMQIAWQTQHAPEKKKKPALPKTKKSTFKNPDEVKKHMDKVKEHEKELKGLHKQIEKKQAALVKRKTEVKRHEEKVSAKIKKLEALEKRIAQKQKKLDEKKQVVQAQHLDLDSKKEEFSKYEAKLEEIREKERQIKIRQQDIHATEVLLRREEDSIIKKLKKMEKDRVLVEKEQDSIVKGVEKLKKERMLLEAREKEAKQIVKEMKAKKKTFERREIKIREKEQMIQADIKEIRRIKKKLEDLKHLEARHERVKKRLREAYSAYESKMGSKVYTPQPVYPKRTEMKRKQSPEHGDITNLITATKQLIMDKRYEDASKNLNKLVSRHAHIPATNPRKREIYYEILGLKNMLKLDLLE